MGPARQAWVTDLVPPRLLANAVALQQMSINIAQVFGPAMASVIVFAFGVDAGILFLLVAALFVIVIPLTTMLPNTQPSRKAGGWSEARRELVGGFNYLRTRTRLRSLWLFWLLIVVCGFAMQTLLPGIMEREFGLDSSPRRCPSISSSASPRWRSTFLWPAWSQVAGPGTY